MDTITIPKTKIKRDGGVVILPIKKYQELCERAAPIYYLKEKSAKELDILVKEGLKDYTKGKTLNASSLKTALKIYARKNRKD